MQTERREEYSAFYIRGGLCYIGSQSVVSVPALLLFFRVITFDKGGDITRRIKKVTFVSLGTLSMIFFLICLSYSHIGVSWLWLWPLLSVFCLVRFLMLQFNISVPKWISVPYNILAVIFIAAFIFTEAKIISAMNASPAPGLDYVITLGAAVRGDRPTSPLLLRIQAAADYLNQNPDTLVIASGGQGAGEDISEAECIKNELILLGIDESRIILEDRSTDTQENIKNSFALIPEGAKVGIVSNSYHIYRALRTAELQGYDACAVPARSLLPLGIHYTVREFFAVTELELKNLIHS